VSRNCSVSSDWQCGERRHAFGDENGEVEDCQPDGYGEEPSVQLTRHPLEADKMLFHWRPLPCHAAGADIHSSLRNFSSRSASSCWARHRNASRSRAVTVPWVGAKQTVGQRVIPLLRMNSATAASYSASYIFLLTSDFAHDRVARRNDRQYPALLESGFLLREITY
jgi:hypothetical protein